jgi:VCBS repeat-containing protein
MPKILKTFLCLSALDVTVLCAAGIGSMLHQEPQAHAAVQTLAVRQQLTDQLVAESTTGASQEIAAGQPGSADFEACARAVRDDYSDDPAQAVAWIRTLCH